MGVRGLTSFLTNDASVWTALPKTSAAADGAAVPVVLDGPALVFHIQYHNKIEWRYDGDYKRFARCVREYFTALAKSGFSVFVVINGLANEAKLEHHVSRENEALQRVSRLIANPTDAHGQKGKELLPKLAFQTFMQVVKEQKVPHVVCDGDAERTMAWMARTRESAVISNDSDCFILENKYGFIQLDSLRVSPAGVTGRMFRRDKFAEVLGIPVKLLPLFAALVGNDHATDAELRRLQRLIYNKYQSTVEAQQQAATAAAQATAAAATAAAASAAAAGGAAGAAAPAAATPVAAPATPTGRSGTLNYKHALIRAIGAFLAAFPSETAALDEVRAMLSIPPEPKPKAMWGDDEDGDGPPGLYEPVGLEPRTADDCAAEAKRVVEILSSASERYVRVPDGDNERDYLGTKDTELVPAVKEDWAPDGRFPDELIQAFRTGDFDWKCMLVLCRRTFWGHTLIENVFEQPSVYLLSRPLRQLAYGILFQDPEGRQQPVVDEYLRRGDGLHFGSEPVLPMRTAPGSGAKVPHLAQVLALPASERRATLLACLGLPAQGSPVSALPTPFMLPVSLVRWWLAHAPVPLSVHTLIAILACLVAGDDAATHKMPLRFSRHAAHACATWSALIEAGNMLCTALLLPLPAVTAPLACDGALVHLLTDRLRRASPQTPDHSATPRDIHAVVAPFVTDTAPLLELYAAAVAGLEDRVDGELAIAPGSGRLELVRHPSMITRNEQVCGGTIFFSFFFFFFFLFFKKFNLSAFSTFYLYIYIYISKKKHKQIKTKQKLQHGPGGMHGQHSAHSMHGQNAHHHAGARGVLGRGGNGQELGGGDHRKRDEELLAMVKPGYDAGIKRTNVQIARESKVANAFAGLGGDGDGEEGSAGSDGEDDDAEEDAAAAAAAADAAAAAARAAAEAAAAEAAKAPKQPEKTGDDDIDGLLEDLFALDDAQDKKKQKQKDKKKGKKGKK
jgi:hypothetical protein